MTGRPASDGVVVVGAGPSGLLAAGILARADIPVTVLDAAGSPSQQSRASTLHAGTMEVLDRHEVPGLQDLPATSHGHYVGLALDLSDAPSRWAGIRRCPQPELLRRLAGWGEAHGVRIVRGEQVTGVEQSGSDVAVRTVGGRRFAGRFAIGADGADSTVRRLLGVPLAGAPAGRAMVRADTLARGLRRRRFERIGRRTVTCAPLDDTTTRLMIHDPDWPVDAPIGEDDFRVAWRESTGEHLPTGFEWIDTFGDTTTYARHMVLGRVALAGDAAHQFVPIGGTALNTALIGADALAGRIVRELRGCPGCVAEHAYEAGASAARESERLQQEARLLFAVGDDVGTERARIAARLASDERYRAGVVRQVSRLQGARATAEPLGPGR